MRRPTASCRLVAAPSGPAIGGARPPNPGVAGIEGGRGGAEACGHLAAGVTAAAVTAHPGTRAAVPLLSQAAVAAFFGVTTRTIRTWQRDGHLHPVRIGRTVRYRPSEVEALTGAPMPPSEEASDAEQ
jgi:predicted DNA-binding transcriptional regulator AlpA